MFTGIIKEIGTVKSITRIGKNLRYELVAPWSSPNAELGASIAIDGVCQTVSAIHEDTLTFDAIDETLKKTTLGSLGINKKVHVEPALRMGDAIDGHLVYGHVDGMGHVSAIQNQQGRFDLSVTLPKNYERYCIDGGSISIQGVSLTIYKVEGTVASVSLIPETLARTRFTSLKVGEAINIEVDTFARYLDKFNASPKNNLSNQLKDWGY
jgi:riboflavin synthase